MRVTQPSGFRYNIFSFLSIPEKFTLSTSVLLASKTPPATPTLSITFLSAASIPLALPPTIARGFGWPKWGLGIEGINGRTATWLLGLLGGNSAPVVGDPGKGGSVTGDDDDEPRIRGWTLVDFYSEPGGESVVPLLVECNFRGRKVGEEGWM